MTTDKLTDAEVGLRKAVALYFSISVVHVNEKQMDFARHFVKHGMERAAGMLEHAAALYRAGKANGAAESAEKHADAIRRKIPHV